MTVLPPMPSEQSASWHGALDLYERIERGWTLIGGQLVHLHCAERGRFPIRPTNDIDTVVDVRADPQILSTLTETLEDLGFIPDQPSFDGRQHRWRRDEACIDVLIPEGVGERAASRRDATGAITLQTSGGTQALQRSEAVPVTIDGREGFIRRPNLVGALVAKAAALENSGDVDPRRHRDDFVVLAGLLTATDFASERVSRTDRRRLQRMIDAIKKDRRLQVEMPESLAFLERLVLAAKLRS